MGKWNKFRKVMKRIFLKNDRIFPALLTIFLIFLILSSGPVTAFEIHINAPSQVRGGKVISFPIEIKTNTGELIPITKITLNITGPAEGIGISVDCELNLTNGGKAYCIDKIAGNATSDVNVTTEFVPPMSYGYGYGYAYWNGTPYYFGYGYGYGGYGNGSYGGAPGTLKFNVTWKPPITPTFYRIKISVHADGKVFEATKTIEIELPCYEELPNLLPGFKGGRTIAEKIIANKTQIITTGYGADTTLTILSLANISASINITTFTGNITPTILNPVKFINIEVNPELNANLSYAIINVSYTSDEVVGLDENSLRLYKWNGTNWNLLPCPVFGCVDTTNNFVYANVTSFSLFGIFGSAAKPAPTAPRYITPIVILPRPAISIKLIAPTTITQQIGTTATYNVTVYNDGEIDLEKVYLNLTGLPNEWYSLPEEISLRVGETRRLSFNLTIPNITPTNYTFILTAIGEGKGRIATDSVEITLITTSAKPAPLPAPVCGNGICEPGEDYINCPKDCPAPTPPSPPKTIIDTFITIITNPTVQTIIVGIILVITFVLLIRKIAWKGKPWKANFSPTHQEGLLRKLKRQIRESFK